MELKDFVKETLVQITEGVKEAQEECRKNGCRINPGFPSTFSNPTAHLTVGASLQETLAEAPTRYYRLVIVVVISVLVSHVPTA